MSTHAGLFYLLGALAALSAVGILFIRNVFYGALLLLVCLLSLSGIYVLAFAEFVAVTQILIYAGGILVLILFGIMLTTNISGKPLVVKNTRWYGGLLTGCLLLGLILFFLPEEIFAEPSNMLSNGNAFISDIGINLMTDYALPFEFSGIVLLIALIGAAITASDVKKEL